MLTCFLWRRYNSASLPQFHVFLTTDKPNHCAHHTLWLESHTYIAVRVLSCAFIPLFLVDPGTNTHHDYTPPPPPPDHTPIPSPPSPRPPLTPPPCRPPSNTGRRLGGRASRCAVCAARQGERQKLKARPLALLSSHRRQPRLHLDSGAEVVGSLPGQLAAPCGKRCLGVLDTQLSRCPPRDRSEEEIGVS